MTRFLAPKSSLGAVFRQLRQQEALLIPKLKYYLRTLYLFTSDDIFSIIIPNVICGVLLALSGSIYQTPSNTISSVLNIILRIPLTLAWIWLNLLAFNVSNQRQAEAIIEDAQNKAWRPIPAGRLTARQAKLLNICLVPTVLLLSNSLSSLGPCISLLGLTVLYNDCGLGDAWLLRGCINAGGYLSFILGALQVSLGSAAPSNPSSTTFSPFTTSLQLQYTDLALPWMATIAIAVSTGIHIMDLYDEEGDRLRDRRTLPLVIGDLQSRWVSIVTMVLLSLAAPIILLRQQQQEASQQTQDIMALLWMLVAGLPSCLVAALVARRLLANRVAQDTAVDRKTAKIWCGWVITIYLLPVWAA